MHPFIGLPDHLKSSKLGFSAHDSKSQSYRPDISIIKNPYWTTKSFNTLVRKCDQSIKGVKEYIIISGGIQCILSESGFITLVPKTTSSNSFEQESPKNLDTCPPEPEGQKSQLSDTLARETLCTDNPNDMEMVNAQEDVNQDAECRPSVVSESPGSVRYSKPVSRTSSALLRERADSSKMTCPIEEVKCENTRASAVSVCDEIAERPSECRISESPKCSTAISRVSPRLSECFQELDCRKSNPSSIRNSTCPNKSIDNEVLGDQCINEEPKCRNSESRMSKSILKDSAKLSGHAEEPECRTSRFSVSTMRNSWGSDKSAGCSALNCDQNDEIEKGGGCAAAEIATSSICQKASTIKSSICPLRNSSIKPESCLEITECESSRPGHSFARNSCVSDHPTCRKSSIKKEDSEDELKCRSSREDLSCSLPEVAAASGCSRPASKKSSFHSAVRNSSKKQDYCAELMDFSSARSSHSSSKNSTCKEMSLNKDDSDEELTCQEESRREIPEAKCSVTAPSMPSKLSECLQELECRKSSVQPTRSSTCPNKTAEAEALANDQCINEESKRSDCGENGQFRVSEARSTIKSPLHHPSTSKVSLNMEKRNTDAEPEEAQCLSIDVNSKNLSRRSTTPIRQSQNCEGGKISEVVTDCGKSRVSSITVPKNSCVFRISSDGSLNVVNLESLPNSNGGSVKTDCNKSGQKSLTIPEDSPMLLIRAEGCEDFDCTSICRSCSNTKTPIPSLTVPKNSSVYLVRADDANDVIRPSECNTEAVPSCMPESMHEGASQCPAIDADPSVRPSRVSTIRNSSINLTDLNRSVNSRLTRDDSVICASSERRKPSEVEVLNRASEMCEAPRNSIASSQNSDDSEPQTHVKLSIVAPEGTEASQRISIRQCEPNAPVKLSVITPRAQKPSTSVENQLLPRFPNTEGMLSPAFLGFNSGNMFTLIVSINPLNSLYFLLGIAVGSNWYIVVVQEAVYQVVTVRR